MKRKHKLYSRPKRPFDKQRIDEEAKIKEEFGLKNKKEIWLSELSALIDNVPNFNTVAKMVISYCT